MMILKRKRSRLIEELAELLEAVESKESADTKAQEQSASAIKKVCYKT